jgi:CheY-like chemotaxis protein
MTTQTDERPRVLIVDDEKFIRDILADFLGMEGYHVRTAEDGAALPICSSSSMPPIRGIFRSLMMRS